MIDWSRCPDVESVPGRCSGAWVVKDSRVIVESCILDNTEAGATPEEIADWFEVPGGADVVRRILIYAGLLADYPPPADAPLVRCRLCGWVHVGIAAPNPWVGRDCFRCKANDFEVISDEEFRRTVPAGVTLQALRWPR